MKNTAFKSKEDLLQTIPLNAGTRGNKRNTATYDYLRSYANSRQITAYLCKQSPNYSVIY